MRFKAGWHLGDAKLNLEDAFGPSKGKMKPKSTVMTRKELAQIRQLTAAIGGESPGSRAVGLLLAVAVASVFAGAALLVRFGGGPPTLVYGTVQGFGLSESQYGSIPLARVWVDDRVATISIGRTATCLAGDRIKLYRRRALLGYSYSPGLPRPCG
jgi:hypothetical protein